AAWLGPIIASHEEGAPAGPQVLWITPLRALAADTEAALRDTLADLAPSWTVERRTGDTSSATRARQRTRLPTALITTPESASLLLSYEDSARAFLSLRLVVVDEWHELFGRNAACKPNWCSLACARRSRRSGRGDCPPRSTTLPRRPPRSAASTHACASCAGS